jgi:hypothetical protein
MSAMQQSMPQAKPAPAQVLPYTQPMAQQRLPYPNAYPAQMQPMQPVQGQMWNPMGQMPMGAPMMAQQQWAQPGMGMQWPMQQQQQQQQQPQGPPGYNQWQ